MREEEEFNYQVVEEHLCFYDFTPIVGCVNIAYISKGTVIGLSKMKRVVAYFAKRPQIQEHLSIQIVNELKKALQIQDVACVIDAKHLCVSSIGIKDIDSSGTVTAEFDGKFKNDQVRKKFLAYINLDTQFN